MMLKRIFVGLNRLNLNNQIFSQARFLFSEQNAGKVNQDESDKDFQKVEKKKDLPDDAALKQIEDVKKEKKKSIKLVSIGARCARPRAARQPVRDTHSGNFRAAELD